MATHSSGPWEVIPPGVIGHCEVTFGPQANGHNDGVAIVVGSVRASIERIDANALLIASAPDLLAACRAALRYIDAEVPYGPEQPAFDLLARAIAKAEGRS